MQKVEIVKNVWKELPIQEGTIKVGGLSDSVILLRTSDTMPSDDLGIQIGSWQDPRVFSGNGKKVWVKWVSGNYTTVGVDTGFF